MKRINESGPTKNIPAFEQLINALEDNGLAAEALIAKKTKSHSWTKTFKPEINNPLQEYSVKRPWFKYWAACNFSHNKIIKGSGSTEK